MSQGVECVPSRWFELEGGKLGWAFVDEGLSSPSCDGLGDESGVTNGVEFELVDGVKVDDGSYFGGVGVAGIMFGVPGCLDGVAIFLPLELGLGLPFEPSRFALALALGKFP